MIYTEPGFRGRAQVSSSDGLAPRPLSGDDWFFWWQMNAPRFENVKWNLYHRMGSGPLFVRDDEETRRWRGLRGGSYRITEKA